MYDFLKAYHKTCPEKKYLFFKVKANKKQTIQHKVLTESSDYWTKN